MNYVQNYTRLYLVRHGQIKGHELKQYIGQTDVGLTALGRAQMEAVSQELAEKNLAAVYSSDLKRSQYGAELIVRRQHVKAQAMPVFREIDFGRWEGLTHEEIKVKFPEETSGSIHNRIEFRFGGAESRQELWDRANTAIKEIIRKHAGQEIALVAHSGVNRVILLQAMGSSPEAFFSLAQDHGCLNIMDFYAHGPARVQLINGPNKVQGM
ncbi:MAG: histidine phosphatase family protein [Deltaproteobacteria bacterium]|nr:histidine phosphatase family protein [Deltaproteobacteria bacterium]